MKYEEEKGVRNALELETGNDFLIEVASLLLLEYKILRDVRVSKWFVRGRFCTILEMLLEFIV